MKKVKKLLKNKKVLIGALIVLIIVIALISLNYILLKPKYPCTQEYVAGTGNIKGDVNKKQLLMESEEFEICANKYGYAVFKNPRKAFKVLKKKYKAGIKLIQKEYKLPPFSHFNYEVYRVYGWQVTIGDEETRRQASFVSSFMDIYENSYKGS